MNGIRLRHVVRNGLSLAGALLVSCATDPNPQNSTLVPASTASLSSPPNHPAPDFDRESATAGSAEVRAVKGSAEYSTGGAPWAVLKGGERLAPGTTLRTTSGATVDLALESGYPVRVLPESELTLEALHAWPWRVSRPFEKRVRLSKGRIYLHVSRLPPGSLYEIRTPKAISRVERPGDYVVSAVTGQITEQGPR
jgi:hypothetical protein